MRILIIEDEKKIALAIKEALVQEGYAADICLDSDEGYSTALAQDYDALILDRMLPGKRDGLQLLSDLRDSGLSSPVLMLTAMAAIKHRIEGLNGGADDYLPKPFSVDELLARIKALLRRPKSGKNTVLHTESLSVNTINHEVTRLGENVLLSKKEFALLEYFMRHQKQVLSKEKIIANVWDFDADILPNNVEVYVRHLRRKLEKPFDAPVLIHTVHGVGYTFDEERSGTSV